MTGVTYQAGDDSIDIGRVRLGQVFDYLRALDQLRNPVRRLVEEQPWSYWLRDLPDHPSVRRGIIQDSGVEDDAGDDYVLRVRRPRITYGPQLPPELDQWVTGANRDDPESAIKVREMVNSLDAKGETLILRFSDDPERIAALEEWRQHWDQWAENERPTRRAFRTFEQLYALHGQLEREGERLEIVLGDGILHWRRPEGRIHHPLLLRRLQLEFAPEVPEFVLRETDHPVELYSAVFRGLDDVDGAALARSQDELDAGSFHPLGGASTSGFLRALVARLSAHGQYLDDPKSSRGAGQAEVYRDPVFFVRPRTLGFASAIERVQEDIRTRQDIPVSLLNIMGIETPRANEDGEEPEQFGPANEVEDVLLSKPANPEQVQIVRRLQRHGAVLVQGPPGTGKTHTIGNLIGHLLAQGKSVLVTSHTSKALRVLHGQVVSQLQPLCVSVLGSDAENREMLERAVAGIAERLSSSAEQLKDEANHLGIERGNLLRRLASTRQALLDCVSGEYREIMVAGRAYEPSDAARHVAQGAQAEAWIPGPVEPGAPLPLSLSEVLELYRTNAAVTEEDERDIDTRLPETGTVPSPEAFAQLVSDEADLRASDRTTGSKYWREIPPVPGFVVLESLRDNAETILEALELGDDWKLALVQAGWLGGPHRQVWDDLLEDVQAWSEEGAEGERLIAEFGPKLPENGDDFAQEQILGEILTHIRNGGRLGGLAILVRPKWKSLLASATVSGRPPSSVEHFDALQALLRSRQARRELRERWDRLMQPRGGPAAEQLGERPEQSAVRLGEVVLERLNWREYEWTPFEARLVASGFDWRALLQQVPPDLGMYGELIRLRRSVSEHLLPALRARVGASRLHAVEAQLTALTEQLLQVATQGGSTLVQRLRGAVEVRDVKSYEEAFARLVDLHARMSIVEQRQTLLRKLEAAALTWSSQIRSRIGIHGAEQPPDHVQEAWRWRQLAQELDRRVTTSPAELQRQIEDLRHRLEQVTAEVIDRQAWAAQVRRVGLKERQALVGWLQTIKKIGKGTGKRAPKLKVEARRQMADCQGAVPVWIMPLARVVENFDPRVTRFDVVIIDEASQSDVMALVALHLGRQVIVVGDEEQVSPDAVGQNLTAVDQLIAQYLRDIPNSHLYDGQTSIYDLAKASFGGNICLREHFRCVPEIIQFSNVLSYDGQLKPLREGSRVRTKPSLVAHRVDGHETASNVNPEEAITIATLIAAAIEQPEYANATFGVVSLVGERQALEVERLLRTNLAPTEYERRRIVCGNSAQFQGDERDVMLLSVVDGPHAGPLSMRDQPLFKKRFNVAASRARDQMWVVYSLDPALDLKPGDLRRRLIQHALDPGDLMRRLEHIEQRVESEFERQVAQRLVAAGFRVVPQWRVGYYRIDLVVVGDNTRLAIECDGDRFHTLEKLPDDMERQAILERLGWTFIRIRGSEFFRNPDAAMHLVFERLAALGITPEDKDVDAASSDDSQLRERVIRRAAEIRREWEEEPYARAHLSSADGQPKASIGSDSDADPIRRIEERIVPFGVAPKSSGEPRQAVMTQLGLALQATPRHALRRIHRNIDEKVPRKSGDGMNPPYPRFASEKDAKRTSDGLFDLPTFFESRGIRWKDNRNRGGGSFWVTGGQELKAMMQELKENGQEFLFTPRGSNATGHKPGWYLSPKTKT